jgi:hypothetical protein
MGKPRTKKAVKEMLSDLKSQPGRYTDWILEEVANILVQHKVSRTDPQFTEAVLIVDSALDLAKDTVREELHDLFLESELKRQLDAK